MTVLEQFEKLLSSLERFQNDYENGDKRLAVGHLDFVRDRCTAMIYLTLAEIEEENNQ